jgi:TPR repeat protein
MKRAAEKGLAEAQNHLGWMYQKGVGTDPNLRKAIQWFRRSAEKGSAAAMYNLGVSYEKGTGVRMDSAKAAELFRNSAQNGNANAQFMLGVIYSAGIGVKQDLAEGHRWFALASCPTRWGELPETAQRWKSAENALTNLSLENTNDWFQSHATRNSRLVKEKLNDWMP